MNPGFLYYFPSTNVEHGESGAPWFIFVAAAARLIFRKKGNTMGLKQIAFTAAIALAVVAIVNRVPAVRRVVTGGI